MAAALPLALVVLGLMYQSGMRIFEGQERTLGASIEWAAETLTTTGYGSDDHWSHPLMQFFVILVQFFGLLIVFLVFPVFLIPFFEERFEAKLTSKLPTTKGWTLIYRWSPAVATFVEELERAGRSVVIFEEDENTARRLHDRGRAIVFANTTDEDPDLRNIKSARGIIVAGSDHHNAVFVMSARQWGYKGPIVALVDNPKRRNAMARAGASAVFTPKHALAATIAARASTRISPRVAGAAMLVDDLVINEVRVDSESSIAGKTLAEAGIGSATGTQIIGEWVAGELIPPRSEMIIAASSILVAVGSQQSMEALAKLATPVPAEGTIVVIGSGVVAQKVIEFLRDAGEEVVIVADNNVEDASYVGDPLDPDLLRQAIKGAQAVIIALDDDAESAFCTAVVRDIAPEIVVHAAAHRAKSVSRIRRAGADFCFSEGQVAAQLIRFQLLGEQTMSLEAEIKITKSKPGLLAGNTVADSELRTKSGCSIVAIERDGNMHVVGLDKMTIQESDAIYLSGDQDALNRFHDIFDAER